ncbi:hypothetical protein ACQ4PT_047555 [Festuca glaucescens]
MADSLVNSAMLKLEGMAFNTVKQQTEVGKRAQGLKDDLAWLQLLLRGADQRRRREINEYIELWVRQTREVAFDAEDLLDEYLHEGQLHCRGVLDLPSFLRWLRHSATGLFVRQSICSDIDAIKARLEQIKKKTEDNSVQLQMSLPTTATSDKRRKRYVDW